MYTEFENNLYQIVSDEEQLSPQILNEKYLIIQRKYYGEHVEYDDISSIEWTRLGHLYRWSYYPYKYATGLNIASIVVNSLMNEKSLSKEKYLEFLSSGSSLNPLDLLNMINIDFTNSNIISNGLQVMQNDIEELEKILALRK